MSKAITPVVLTAILIAAVLFSGCAATSPETSPEDVITEEKDFAGFTRLDIGSAFNVEITRSDSFSVIISADKSLFDLIDVFLVRDTLKIDLNPRHIFTDFTLGAKTLKVKITMPALYGLDLSGASQGTINGFKSAEDFSLVVSGASSLETVNIIVGNARFEVSGASRVSGNMTAGNAEFGVSGASSIELSGSANDMIIDISGASRVDLTDFPTADTSVALSGASEATINSHGRLDTALSGASRLYFYGNPTMGNVSVSGASTIKHR